MKFIVHNMLKVEWQILIIVILIFFWKKSFQILYILSGKINENCKLTYNANDIHFFYMYHNIKTRISHKSWSMPHQVYLSYGSFGNQWILTEDFSRNYKKWWWCTWMSLISTKIIVIRACLVSALLQNNKDLRIFESFSPKKETRKLGRRRKWEMP